MAIVEYALCPAHRSNISRYERLLQTYLTDIERTYVEMRLLEERAALRLDRKQPLRGDDPPTAENVSASVDGSALLPFVSEQPRLSPEERDD
jgi:hypothetical protein